MAGEGGRAEAIQRLVALVGAVIVARAVGEGPLRQEVLSAVAPAPEAAHILAVSKDSTFS